MKIGELGEQVGMTPATIRYYESIGLLPEARRDASGYRTYTTAGADRLRFIQRSQASGLSLDEIRSILEIKDAGGRSCGHTRELLARHLADLDAQIERMQHAREELRSLADRAERLDPAACNDPNRCQVLGEVPGTAAEPAGPM